MIEEKIDALTAAINRLNTNLEKASPETKAAVAAAAKDGKAAGAKAAAPKAAAKKSQHTFDQVKAAILQVKEDVGQDDAKAIIESALGAGGKLAGLASTPEHYDAIMAACEEKLGAGGGEAEPDEEEDGL